MVTVAAQAAPVGFRRGQPLQVVGAAWEEHQRLTVRGMRLPEFRSVDSTTANCEPATGNLCPQGAWACVYGRIDVFRASEYGRHQPPGSTLIFDVLSPELLFHHLLLDMDPTDDGRGNRHEQANQRRPVVHRQTATERTNEQTRIRGVPHKSIRPGRAARSLVKNRHSTTIAHQRNVMLATRLASAVQRTSWLELPACASERQRTQSAAHTAIRRRPHEPTFETENRPDERLPLDRRDSQIPSSEAPRCLRAA